MVVLTKLFKLQEAGYFIGKRDSIEWLLPNGLKQRMAEFPGKYVLFDPQDDRDGFCIVGDNITELVNEAYQVLIEEDEVSFPIV